MLPRTLNLLPCSWNFQIFTENIFNYAYYKKIFSAAQSSGRVKIFWSEQQQVRAALKEIRGNIGLIGR
jgi:hypothetical protein